MAMVAEELLRVGVTTLVRIGTCGGLLHDMAAGDIVVVSAAAPYDGATRRHVGGDPYVPLPDFGLTAELARAASGAGLRTHIGPVATVDLLYDPDPDAAEHLRSLGLVALEMESSILFYLAARETAAGRAARAAAILTVSDLVGPAGTDANAFLAPLALEQATTRMVEVALSVVAPDAQPGHLTGGEA
jgi:purine-nucleoside phosphorylase